MLTSMTTFTSSFAIAWGEETDVTVSGDYDGDGRADMAVYRPSTRHWNIRWSSTAYSGRLRWGGAGDTPIAPRP